MSEKKIKFDDGKNLTKEQLKNRLYDQGFTHYTMQSVVRNNNKSLQNKPLIARLYSLNNNLIKEAKQPQTTILYNRQPQELKKNSQLKKIYEDQMNYGYTTKIEMLNKKNKIQKQKTKLEPIKKSINLNLVQEQNENMKKQQKQTRIVLDKLRHSYLEQTKYYRTIPRSFQNTKIEIKNAIIQKSNIQSQQQAIDISLDPSYRRSQSELDTYINLILRNSPNIDEFVYLIQNPNSEDPYDLVLRNYFQINQNLNKKKNLKLKSLKKKKNMHLQDYYTISVKGLCRFHDGRPIEFIGLTEWLKERETYDKIRNLGFFADFLKWKTVKLWKKSYKSFKKQVALKNLEEKLFINYPELKDAIFSIKEVFFRMNQLNFLDFNFNKDNNNDVITIREFVQIQEKKAHQTQLMISDLSQECHDIYVNSLENRLELLRNEVAMNSENENIFKKNNQIMRIQDNPYENLGFPENMSYDKRSVLRKECFRFIKFAHFVDFLAVDCLIKIYINSVNNFITEVCDIINPKDVIILREIDKQKPIGLRESLFKISVQSNLNYTELQDSLDIVEEIVPDFKYPKIDDDDTKCDDYKDYSLLTYPFVIDYNVVEDFNEQQKKLLEYGDNRMFKQQIVNNIDESCLIVKPSINIFQENVDKILGEGMSSLQAFVSFSKHSSMKKYYAILEEWEEYDENNKTQLENSVLNPEEWIDMDLKFNLEKKIKLLFEDEFKKARVYLQKFKEYLQIDWEYFKLDYSVLINKNLAKPAITYNAILNLLEYQRNIFVSQIPFLADLGLFRVDSKDLKLQLMDKPKEILLTIIEKIMKELIDRYQNIKLWLEESIQKLKINTTDIEKFVQQTNNLKQIEKVFAYYKDEIKTSKEVIDTLKRFQIDLSSDLLQLYQDCKNNQQSLTSQIIVVNENLNKNKEIFSTEICELNIPQLEQKCKHLEDALSHPKYLDIKEMNILQELQNFKISLQKYEEESKNLNYFQEVLGIKKTKFTLIQKLNEELKIKILLWESHKNWFDIIEDWKNTSFNEIDIDQITQITEKYQRNVSRCRKQISMSNEILKQLDQNIKNFLSLIPIVVALRNDKLTKNHISEIEELIGESLNFKEMLLKDFLKDNILEQQNKIIAISVQVTQEAKLKIQLNEVEDRYGKLIFPLKSFKEDSPKDSTYILGDCTDLINEVDKLIMIINNVYGSRYLNEYKKLTADKRKDILMLQELLFEWMKFQKNYIYLESIFSQPEMKKPLQLEVKEFEDNINKVYKQNMKKIMVIQSIAQLNKQRYIEQYVMTFQKHNDILHELNKKINDFLDKKREAFPRFYFVANDELIHILANYDNPIAVQGFVGKLFENISEVTFSNNEEDEKMNNKITSTSIFGIKSREGEKLNLKGQISIKSESVDKWMKKLEDYMRETLYRVIKEGLNNYTELSRKDWYLKNTAQVTAVITQIAWTINAEEFLKVQEKDDEEESDILETIQETQKNLEILISLVRESLQFHQYRSVIALITSEVHNRDILEFMMKKGVKSREEFIWQQQLRYHYDEGKEWSHALYVRQVTSIQQYGYEYYGPCARIVITPLTDRCWLTITSALHMKLGAAPQGPAGTGKTESTKDLAKSLGRFCLVFNCSDQINCKMMEKLFRGIIQQGAWTCLDEFNRIDIEVLSVVAQQLLELRLGLLVNDEEKDFYFAGSYCKLDKNCGVFITMNPGYAGRTELPDNLKALFRPISMMIPDYALIAQILLFSQGFLDSKNLATKMIKLYKLSSEQLSQQKHYDFGMRAVKSVLEMAGRLKQKSPDVDENLLLIKALQDSNIPKFLKQDLPLFNALISDLFPNLELEENQDHNLIQKAIEYLQSINYIATPLLQQKIIQLSDTLNVRFGTMIVGTAMTGKSTIIKSLKASKNIIFDKHCETNKQDYLIQENSSEQQFYQQAFDQGIYKVRMTMINPKSVTLGELYGEENQITKDWTDGLASHYIRAATTSEDISEKWICFDGPVDALWIENMNSVLDDSRMLCLSNGQRIRLNNNIRILFEVDSLEQASPATVSRCGMVYVAEEVLGWKSITQCWQISFKKRQEELQIELLQEQQFQLLEELFDQNFESLLNFYQSLNKMIDTVDYQCVKGMCNILDSVINQDYGFNVDGNEEYKEKYVILAFIFACAWGFASTLPDKEDEKFDNMIKKKFSNIDFSADSITNCYLDPETVSFQLYSSRISDFVIGNDVSFWDILVPTIDSLKISHIIEEHFKAQRSVFLTGYSGTGKSVLAINLLKKFNLHNNIDNLKFNFSAQTKSQTVQDTIMNGLFFLSQKSRGAHFGRKNVIFVDDVNMPAKEVYGAQPPIELLRQFFDFQFFYDLKDKNQITIQDTFFFCLAAPAEGGRNSLSPRFTRHFNLITFPSARNTTISRIFNTILENFLNDVDESIKNISHDLVNASIEFYEKICSEKLPTPKKFHYTFNLRDLSKVFMGITQIHKPSLEKKDQLIRLWTHEFCRVFYDRLNSKEDKEWFNKNIVNVSETFLRVSGNTLNLNKSFFSDIFSLQEQKPQYVEIFDSQKILKELNDYLIDYNEVNKNKLNLVFFQQALEHCIRILRIIRQQRGNALLVGVGGIGKSSLSKIATFIAKYQFRELESQKNFNSEKFKEWIRKQILLQCAGDQASINGSPLCLLINDSQIVDNSILEDINNLLNSGEIPNIFPNDEKEKLQKALIELYEEKKIILDMKEIWKMFIQRVRNNLHIILCMSPVGDSLRLWCRQFPAVVNCCTIDWYEEWSGEALESVANNLLDNKGIENLKEACEIIKLIHNNAIEIANKFQNEMQRKYFITPKMALDNINLFVGLFKQKKEKQKLLIDNFGQGSVKLEEMSKIVAKLKISLKEAQPLLEEQRKLTNKKVIELEKAAKIANKKKENVEKEASIIQVKKDQIEMINNQAKSQLQDALPRIQKAENEVRNIDRKKLNELRGLNSPPMMIEFIFSTVCIALQEKYINWKSTGIKMLNDLTKFIEKLISKIDLIKEKGSSVISQSVLKNLKKNLDNEFFSEQKLNTNIIARPIGLWCKAIYDFAILKKKVEPLEKNAHEMALKLQKAENEYSIIEKDLMKCKIEFDKLQNEFNEMDNKKKALENDIEQSKLKLNRAEKLTSLLSEEGERWKQSVEDLKAESLTLTGDIFLSSAYVSYLGPLTSVYRKILQNNWFEVFDKNAKSLKLRKNFDFLNIMGDPLVLKEWTMNGLPSDEVSKMSGLSTMIGKKWPMLIDPQLQAKNWLKNILSLNDNFMIIKQDISIRKFNEQMKLALNNGYIILYEDCSQTLNSSLDSVINRSYYANELEKTMLINFNEESVFYHEDFQLFMTTKLSNPDFLPDVFIRTNVINFTVTLIGLEDQLLAEVMILEKPEDEKLKNENIEKISEFKRKMRDIEEKILNLLVTCDKSPVEDENLVQTLQYSKITSREIDTKMKSIEKISKEISKAREIYRDIAKIGSILFFVISDIALIDPMYQYSLQAIIKLFKVAIKQTNISGDKRINAMKENIIRLIYKNTSRGVFEAHKKILSFLIAIYLDLKTGKLDNSKWQLFLKGSGVIDREGQKAIPQALLFSESSWDLSNVLEKEYESFKGIIEHFSQNISFWEEYANSSNIYQEELPEEYHNKCDSFDRLLFVKIFKPEQILLSIGQYIEEKLGKYYNGSIKLKPQDIYDDSDNITPIIFILSKGADPSSSIQKLGEEKGFKQSERFFLISLGQGQGLKAQKLIEQGGIEGNWVLLENCHLAKTWMPDLERIIEKIQNNKDNSIHKDFRLFLTSMPASYFPVSVLQNSLKITTEPPRGMKANIIRTLDNIDESFFEKIDLKNTFSKLTLGLCFFHAILQERRKFGPLGWNILYEFNNSDIEAAKNILQMFFEGIENKNDVPWDSIIFLTGFITYGGRVTDDLDQRLLITTLKKFYNPNVSNDRFKFTNLENYLIPKNGNLKLFKEFVVNLPEEDNPELFGLHQNADISYQNQEAEKIMKTILMVMPKEIGTVGNQAEKVQEMIDQFLDLENGLPETLDFKSGHKDHFLIQPNGLIPPLSTFLTQELARFNKLIIKIKISLENLQLAIKGKISMSSELDQLYNALLINQVPGLWSQIAYPSLKSLSSWFKNLKQRIEFMDHWLKEFHIPHYWISGFFFPQGFLTGVLQTHARKLNEAIDKFSFSFKATDLNMDSKNIQVPEDGVFVSGLFLEGANWDLKKKSIVDSLPKQMFVSMPLIHFIPKEKNEQKANLYSCPLYKTMARAGELSTTGQSTNFILEVKLTCEKNPEMWIMRGVALFCELNDQ